MIIRALLTSGVIPQELAQVIMDSDDKRGRPLSFLLAEDPHVP